MRSQKIAPPLLGVILAISPAPCYAAVANYLGIDEQSDLLMEINDDGTFGRTLGAVSPPSPTSGVGIRGLHYDRSRGTLLGIDGVNGRLVGINPRNADTWTVGPLGTESSAISGLARSLKSDEYFTVDSANDALFRVDPETGSASLVGAFAPRVDGMFSIAFDTRRGELLGVDVGSDSVYVIDTHTGATTLRARLNVNLAVISMTYDPRLDRLIAFDDLFNQFIAIDPVSGTFTTLGSPGDSQIFGLALIPTPPTASLLALTSIPFFSRRRHRPRSI